MTEKNDLSVSEINLLLDIFSRIDSYKEKFSIDEFGKDSFVLDTLLNKKYLSVESQKYCENCNQKISPSHKFCDQCKKPTVIKQKLNYFLTNKFLDYYEKKIDDEFSLNGWKKESSNLYSKSLERCYLFKTKQNFEDIQYFTELGKAAYNKAHRLILLVPYISELIGNYLIYSELPILLIDASSLMSNNLTSMINKFLEIPISITVLRENAFRRFIERGTTAESILLKMMKEKDYHSISDLFIWGFIEEEALIKSSTKQKVGHEFQHIVGVFFSLFINPKTVVLGSSGEPDIISHFIDNSDEICIISCKATNKKFYTLSKKDIDEIDYEIETLKLIEETMNKISLVIFIAPKFKVNQINYYSNYLEEKWIGLKVSFIPIESLVTLFHIAYNFRSRVRPNDFLTFFKKTKICNDEMISKLESLISKREIYLSTQIHRKTMERQEIRKWSEPNVDSLVDN